MLSSLQQNNPAVEADKFTKNELKNLKDERYDMYDKKTRDKMKRTKTE